MRKNKTTGATAQAALAMAIVATAPLAFAASGTWSGDAGDGLWQTPGNWDNVPGTNDGVLGTSSDLAIFTGAPTFNTAEVDLNRNVAGLSFESSDSPFFINATPNSGNTLYLSNGGTIQTASTVSPAVETFSDVNAPLVLNGTSYTFANHSSSLNAGLRIRGNVAGGHASAATLTLDGAQGAITGSASEIHGTISNGASSALGIAKNGTGTWELAAPGSAPNTYSGDTAINGGVLRVASSSTSDGAGGLSANSNYTVNSGGTLRVSVAGATAKSITVNLGGAFSVSDTTFNVVNLNANSGPALLLNFAGGTGSQIQVPINLTGTTAGHGGVTLLADGSTPAGIDLGQTTSPIDLGSVKRVFNIGDTAGTGYDLRFRGPVSGGGANGGITKTGPGILRLDQASSFSGNIDVQEGVFRFNGSNLLTGNVSITLKPGTGLTVNASASDVIPLNVESGPALHFDYATATHSSAITPINVLISLGGSTANEGGIKYSASSSTGPTEFSDTGKTLALGSVIRTFDIGKGNASNAYDLRVRGPVTGSGGILKTGSGILRLDHPSGVSFTGSIEVREGDLRFSSGTSNTLSGVPELLISGGNVHIFGGGGATQTFGPVTVTKGSTTGGAATSTIAAPSFTFNVDTPDNVTIGTVLANGGGTASLVKNLGGSVQLDRAPSYTGSTTVNAGTLSLAADLTTSSALNVTGGRLELRVTAQPNRVIKTPSLNISGTGQVDLQHNKMIVTGGTLGTASGGDYNGITGDIQDGRNGGTWDGSGIMTSRPDADTGLTGLGVRAATAGQVFAGHALNAGDVMVMYTYVGDATLDGIINGDDFFDIDAGFSASATGYANGDFDYNGRIDADDYFLIDRNYSRQTGPITPGPGDDLAGVTAVPEPTSAATLALLAGALLRRRRRQ